MGASAAELTFVLANVEAHSYLHAPTYTYPTAPVHHPKHHCSSLHVSNTGFVNSAAAFMKCQHSVATAGAAM